MSITSSDTSSSSTSCLAPGFIVLPTSSLGGALGCFSLGVGCTAPARDLKAEAGAGGLALQPGAIFMMGTGMAVSSSCVLPQPGLYTVKC